jgi:hypothetical protein
MLSPHLMQLGAQMFEKGEIAVMLIYGGEDQVSE